MIRWTKAFLLAALLLAAVLAGVLLWVDNHAPVALRLLHWTTPELPVLAWLYAAFAGGALLGWCLCFFGSLRGRLERRRLKRSLRARDAPPAGDAAPAGDEN